VLAVAVGLEKGWLVIVVVRSSRVCDAPLSEQRLQVLLLLSAHLHLDRRGLLLRLAIVEHNPLRDQSLQAQVARGGWCHLLNELPDNLPGSVTSVLDDWPDGSLARQVLTHEALAEVERPHTDVNRRAVSR
jgi:hypothetical protein